MKAIILPGMGADSDMYADSSYENLQDVYFSDWPSYGGEKSISDLAERIIDENNIQENQIVGGSSLGGIVAAEIAKIVKVEKLILIGSTLITKSINPVLKNLSRLADIAPIDLIQIFAGKVSLSIENRLLEMFSKSDSSFIRAMCKAVFEWEGNPESKCEMAHIHGAKDKVIFPPKHNAKIIEDGWHLIAMTHSREVSEFIRKNVQETS
ncbi:alpha/beta fold hydrolase [Thermodesulfobacteriota bacterium]